MSPLTIKLPEELDQALTSAAAQEHLSKAEVVRRALARYLHATESPRASALEQAGDIVGCFSGGPDDLSTNPRHLDDFGRV